MYTCSLFLSSSHSSLTIVLGSLRWGLKPGHIYLPKVLSAGSCLGLSTVSSMYPTSRHSPPPPPPPPFRYFKYMYVMPIQTSKFRVALVLQLLKLIRSYIVCYGLYDCFSSNTTKSLRFAHLL